MFLFCCSDVQDSSTKTSINSDLKHLVSSRNYNIVMTETELNGPERFAADNLLTEDACQALITVATVGYTNFVQILTTTDSALICNRDGRCRQRRLQPQRSSGVATHQTRVFQGSFYQQSCSGNILVPHC